ncbi:MAG: hypothetical protein IT573_03970 [Deltaproteobacteria bacterium]|nr:hypothetical protein [Deltaproteobacteria bacterium]
MKIKPSFTFAPVYKRWSYVLMAAGFAALAAGAFLDPARMWVNLLINNFYYTSLALAAAFFLAILYVTNAGWASNFKRVPEAMTRFLPVALLLMLTLVFGMHSLYHWSHHDAVLHDPLLRHKEPYLNVPFFFGRMVAYFGLWILLTYLLRRYSLRQDANPDLSLHRRSIRVSALFILVFALTFALASYDWLMSLEPHWYSTIYSVYTFSSLFLHGLAAIALLVILLQERGYFGRLLNENHLHDLGKMIFAFSCFWAYIWVSQYLLIWYSNIPEETAYFWVRTDPDWLWLFALNFALNWLIPFLILLPRAAKRSAAVLKRVCVVLLIGFWLDIFLLVAPNVLKARSIGWMEILSGLGFAALFAFVTGKALERAPLIPRNDPYLQESFHLHQ